VQPTVNILEIVLLILAILVGFAVLGTIALVLLRLLRTKQATKKQPESRLEIAHLDKDLADRVHEVKYRLLPEKERKKFKKKKAEKRYDSTVFVVDFHPSLRAHEVDRLREEIDIITQVATPKDEVVVRIDSAGGTVNAYGHAASQLLRIREAGIPLTICVDEIAASGGYMCAAVADKIIAAPFAYIGSIGVVAGMPNFVGLMQKLGVRYVELTAGANKRTLTPFSEPTPQQEAIELERLQAIHSAFKNLIKQRRPNLDIDKVADGNYWLALDAKELGLVDIIETSDEYLSQQSSGNRRILKISCRSKSANLLERVLDAIR
jgi:serine protease SohB